MLFSKVKKGFFFKIFVAFSENLNFHIMDFNYMHIELFWMKKKLKMVRVQMIYLLDLSWKN